MILHVTQIHPRDAWCAEWHLRSYLTFCDWAVVAVDGDEAFARLLGQLDARVTAFAFHGPAGLPDERINENGVCYHEEAIRQASLDRAMLLSPTMFVFGDADEVPTPNIANWIQRAALRPQTGHRYYADWVNLWGDARHAIGGGSAWSFQSPRGNKKCLAMQPGGEMRYVGTQHTGMEPGRPSGGPAPTGPGHTLLESPKLLHLKYGWAGYPQRPESRLARHHPAEMLKGGEVVDVPAAWLWDGMESLMEWA